MTVVNETIMARLRLRQIAEARLAMQRGLGIRLEDLDPGAAQHNVAAGKPRAKVV